MAIVTARPIHSSRWGGASSAAAVLALAVAGCSGSDTTSPASEETRDKSETEADPLEPAQCSVPLALPDACEQCASSSCCAEADACEQDDECVSFAACTRTCTSAEDPGECFEGCRAGEVLPAAFDALQVCLIVQCESACSE